MQPLLFHPLSLLCCCSVSVNTVSSFTERKLQLTGSCRRHEAELDESRSGRESEIKRHQAGSEELVLVSFDSEGDGCSHLLTGVAVSPRGSCLRWHRFFTVSFFVSVSSGFKSCLAGPLGRFSSLRFHSVWQTMAVLVSSSHQL